jgi:hypothetical protein
MPEFDGVVNTLNQNPISSNLPSAVPQPPLPGAVSYPDQWAPEPAPIITTTDVAEPGINEAE